MTSSLLRGVWHHCYQDSVNATAALSLSLASQRALGTWQKKIAYFIARTEFARQKFIQGGLRSDRIVVKPCFVHPDPGARLESGESALFLGRLSPEKGLRTLLEAWNYLRENIPLRIIGDGPIRAELEEEVVQQRLNAVEVLGRLPDREILPEIKRAKFVVFPSEWYEGLPLTIAEAFACGVPVIASRLGSMSEIVTDGVTGLHFEAGNPSDLAAKVEWAWSHSDEMARMGRAARAEYEAKYTAERNYKMLMTISQLAIQSALGGTELFSSTLPTREARQSTKSRTMS